MPAYIKIKS